MYTSFFGLNEKPFSITPDPRYLFMSERHTEGLAHLIYGVKEGGGFIQLTGEVGTGKTTLVRSLLQQLPDNADVALILNPQLSRTEFLSAICEELGVPLPAQHDSVKALTNALNAYLLRNHGRGRHTVLIVDEAQNLKVDVLEQVRLLTNLETTKQKLLQIILIGQPELRALLSRNDMRQLAQRITGRYHLEPLNREESNAYIDHRLKVAGAVGEIFTPQAKRELFRLSAGVPRMINVIADRGLLGAFTVESHRVTPALVRSAAAEVYDRPAVLLGNGLRWLGAGLAVAALAGLAWWAGSRSTEMPEAREIALASSPPAVSSPAPAAQVTAPVPTTVASPVTATADSTAARPAADAAEPREALGSLLAQAGEKSSSDQAFAALFKLWRADYTRGPMRACKQAESYGLFCLFQRGSLSQIRSLDRPVILTLRDDASNPHQVVLSGLRGDDAWLILGDRAHRVAAAELGEYWFGEYLLLWRPEIGRIKSFFPGMNDPDVRWIRQSLEKLQGRPVEPMDSEIYDEALEARVREYQRDQRLNVDGLVGQQTQIAMNTGLGAPDRPRLSKVD